MNVITYQFDDTTYIIDTDRNRYMMLVGTTDPLHGEWESYEKFEDSGTSLLIQRNSKPDLVISYATI